MARARSRPVPGRRDPGQPAFVPVPDTAGRPGDDRRHGGGLVPRGKGVVGEAAAAADRRDLRLLAARPGIGSSWPPYPAPPGRPRLTSLVLASSRGVGRAVAPPAPAVVRPALGPAQSRQPGCRLSACACSSSGPRLPARGSTWVPGHSASATNLGLPAAGELPEEQPRPPRSPPRSPTKLTPMPPPPVFGVQGSPSISSRRTWHPCSGPAPHRSPCPPQSTCSPS